MRDHYPMMAERSKDEKLKAEVAELLPKVLEFSEFLTKQLGLEDVGAYYPHRVTYHASCHGLRNLHVGDGPMKLLRAVRGIDLVEIEDLEQCCGFGGTFAVKNAEVSSAMLAEKVRGVLNTRAEACTACDNSCLMHIQRSAASAADRREAGASGGDSGGRRRRRAMSGAALDPKTAPKFPMAAKALMGDSQLRKNVRHATKVIQAKRARVVDEMPDWQELREAGKQIRQHTMEHLDFYLEQFERNCTARGRAWCTGRGMRRRRGRSLSRLVKRAGRSGSPTEVIKIKSMTTEEIQLNKALEAAGIHAYETDLAELIIQLGHDQPSHIVVPALHKNRAQIREIFQREMNLPESGRARRRIWRMRRGCFCGRNFCG